MAIALGTTGVTRGLLSLEPLIDPMAPSVWHQWQIKPPEWDFVGEGFSFHGVTQCFRSFQAVMITVRIWVGFIQFN